MSKQSKLDNTKIFISCPKCKKQRLISLRAYRAEELRYVNNEINCQQCKKLDKTSRNNRKKNIDEILSTKTIIFWSKYTYGSNLPITYQCGQCERIKTAKNNRALRSILGRGICGKCSFFKNCVRFKGGRHLNRKGYILKRKDFLTEEEYNLCQSMITKDNCIKEHRLVMAMHLGRPLEVKEVVHHLNGIKHDNRIENLELVDSKSHAHANKLMIENFHIQIEYLQELLKQNNIPFNPTYYHTINS